MKNPFSWDVVKKCLLFLGAACVICIALSFLPPVQEFIVHVGEYLKGSDIRRPEKWFSKIRSALCCATGMFAFVYLLGSLVQKNWISPKLASSDAYSLFLSDANILSICIAAVVSIFLTLVLKNRIDNMKFFVVQIFFFALSYLLSSFCLFHNRHLQGGCHSFLQWALLCSIVLWLLWNFLPDSQGMSWHGTARIRFRYQMPIAIYAVLLALLSMLMYRTVTVFSSSPVNENKKLRVIFSFAYAFVLASLYYVPNIFGDDSYHIHAWEGTIYELLNFVPYDAEYDTALYGHYGLFYLFPMRLLHLVGVPYNVALASLQFLVGAIAFLSVFYVLSRFIRNDAVFYLFMFSTGSFFQYGLRSYFQQDPHRFFWGAVISACLVFFEKDKFLSSRRFIVLCLLGVASFLWNTETGIVCMGGISVYLFIALSDFSDGYLTRRNIRALGLSILFPVAEALLAMLLANVYNLLCGGHFISPKDFMFPLISDLGVVENLEWPLVGVHGAGFAYFVLFMIAICFALVLKFTIPRSGSGNEKLPLASPQVFAGIAFLGLGLMSVYMAKCSKGFLNISYLQLVMLIGGLWGLLDASGANSKYPLFRWARLIIIVVFSALVLDNVTLPERILMRRRGGWRTEKLNSFVELLREELPEGVPGFGQNVPELYAYMDRDVQIHMTDWANLRFWMKQDSRPVDYLCERLKEYDAFFANETDRPLVPETANFYKIAGYSIGGQHFGLYVRKGKSLELSAFEGEGTLVSPYRIAAADDLLSLARHVNAGMSYEGCYFQQTADIDLSSIRNWIPIADGGSFSFNGNYDGGGHCIRNLRIRKTKLIEEDGEHPALFGRLGGRVCNLGIESGQINGVDCASAIAASCSRPGALIANCWNRADVQALEWVAGIATNFTGGTLVCCVNFGKISKEFVLHGGLDGISTGGSPTLWECRPMEGEDFDFGSLSPLLEEAKETFDLGGMKLIPWDR